MKKAILKLNVKDRILALNILPKQGNMVEMIAADSLNKKIGLTSDELDFYEVTAGNGTVSWNLEKDMEVDIEINHAETAVLKAVLKSNDEAGTIPFEALSVYRKIEKL